MWLRLRCQATLAMLCGLVFWAVANRVAGSEGPPPTLSPKTYLSPSSKYSLLVNPSDLYGRGSATYKLTREGREIWSGEKPYTLWDACVGDDGLAAGYAYSQGWRGFSEAGHKAGMGDFRVVIIDARGKERLNQVAKREESRFLHTPPNPLASGLIMDGANDRLVIRVSDSDVNRQAESWWPYQLSTGKAAATFRPKELMADARPVRYVMDAKPVKGTPLTLLHWWRYDWEKEHTRGARFTLIGQDGMPIWSMDLSADYESGVDEKAAERLMASLHRSGGILATEQPGRFDLRFVKDSQRVSFVVSRAANGPWIVSEVARRAFVETTAPEPRPADRPLLTLRPAGRIVLNSPFSEREPEVRNVSEFVFDDKGRIAFLRSSGSKSLALLVVDQEGKVLHCVPLDSARSENGAGWSGLTCVGLNKYLLIRGDLKDSNKMEGALVDVATGKATPIPGFTTTVLSEVAGFRDGGFVVKGGLAEMTSDNSLLAFDSRGKRLWSLPGNGDVNDPGSLFSPNDVTVTSDGMVAVVDVIRKAVQFFDRAGRYDRAVDLKKAWGREPVYPSGISADRDGGVVIHDFQGDPPIVRMAADGTVRAELKPRLKNGRTFRLSDAQIAPDGVLWVSDGHALYRLTDSGTAHRVLGEAPDPRLLDQAATVTLDSKGQIYAAVARTGAVHVFEPDGKWVRVCVPDAGDVPGELSSPHLTVADSGDVYLGLGMLGGNRFLHFSSEGKRIGIEASKLDEICEEWYAQPGTARRWVLGYEKVHLIEGTGAVVRTITRRADGLWLERPKTASAALDGSIAIMSGGKNLRAAGAIAVSLYSPHGEPIRTFILPPGEDWSYSRIAYDGKRVVIAGEKGTTLFDSSGKAVGRFIPSQDEEASWTPFLAPDGRRLLLFDGTKTFQCFELP
jgi:hypothetical protein